jgi:glutamate-1-semialdehyde 2,1-aminomutase
MIPDRDVSMQEWTARAEQVIPGGVNSGRRRVDPEFVVVGGGAAKLRDASGRTYLDYYGGAGTAILGHGARPVASAMRQAASGPLLTGAGVTPGEVKLAETIVAAIPSVDQVLLCNSGSEATLYALRLARAVTRREDIIKMQGHYHGHHDAVLTNVHSRPDAVGRPDPHSRGMLQSVWSRTHVCDYNDLEGLRALLERHPEGIAAVLLEPIAHNGPTMLPDDGYLAGVRALCDEHGALLIFDEVISGFRHAMGGYQSIAGVLPDLTTAGKAMGNGQPVAMLGGRRELMQRWTTVDGGDVMFGGTYNGNSASVAAATETLRMLRDGRYHDQLFARGQQMRDGLSEIVAEAGVEATVTGFGSVFCLWFGPGPIRRYSDWMGGDVDLFRRYRLALREHGVFEKADVDGARSVISTAHTEDEIGQTLEAARKALSAAVSSRG